MEDLNNFLDLPSPYTYGEGDQYLDTNASESQSSVNSPYDMSSLADINGFSGVYPSPESEDESSQPSSQQKPATKRKRENRYKNAPPSVLSRRRAQNRASQRAYRERKDQRIKDLEQMLNDAKQRNDVLGQAYASLHAEYITLKSAHFKEQSYQPDFSHNYNLNIPSGDDRLDMNLYVYSDMAQGYTL
ncbi:hypothetical protein B0T22DRAFT_201485 [Podospora appendiculata]|uniref:Putative transcription factor kapC n=1 Tax=Podospora appendiculata TaxID=314037 RepID=A0AAE0X492_9PEZI|nr:hypothetical protein B0T22DRAFT_201485 [Podospora appendiculata]